MHAMVLPIVTAAVFGAAVVFAAAQDIPSGQQNATPAAEKGDNPGAKQERTDWNRRTSGTNDQSGPCTGTAVSPNAQGDQATHSVCGRRGVEEPGSHAPTSGEDVLVNGKLNVPGAPAESQTVPAKYSERNDKIDHLPIMAMPTGLTDAQKKNIADAVRSADTPTQQTSAKAAEELPWDVEVHDIPVAANDMPDLKYVRTPDRILLVRPTNRVVIGEIKE